MSLLASDALYRLLTGSQSHRAAVAALLQDRVEHAAQVPEICANHQGAHAHGVFWSTSGSYTASGSDAAVLEVEETLKGKPDNFRKLVESGASTKVLFVWVDLDTDGSITRPLAAHADERWEHFELPARQLELGTVDELWIVHRQTRRGWRWAGDKWTALEGV